jgi:hypothetical protein
MCLWHPQPCFFNQKIPYVCVTKKLTMKKIFQLAVILMAFIPAVTFAQTEHQADSKEWAELKTFHTLMAASFHPVEDGNYVPLKAKAEDLFKAAQAWQHAAIPSNFKVEQTKAALRKLTLQCAGLHKAVLANHPDAELKTLITQAHDTFHTVVGECRVAE